MRNSSPKTNQKFYAGDAMNLALGEVVLNHIEYKYKPLKCAPEFLARAANVTPATAINWIRRKCVPQADNIGELVKNDPEFREKLMIWLETSGD